MKPSRVASVLARILESTWPAFIWGPPGVGKSSVVRQVANQLNLEVLDLRASLLDPTDLRGIPSIQEGKAVWCPPSFLPSDPKSQGILFLDEINAAPPLVQASLYQLVLDRKVGEYTLPPGWRILAAGNRAEDRAVVFRLSSALANRFIHLDFDVDFEDWRDWAIGVGIHPLVIGFLAARRELLLKPAATENAFPTPRSWEMASDICRTFGSPEKCADLLRGIVGEGPAVEFIAFGKRSISEEQFLAILADPENVPLPKELGDIYALVAWFLSQAKDGKVRLAASLLLERLEPEFAVLLSRDMIKADGRFILVAGFKRFQKAHGDLLRD